MTFEREVGACVPILVVGSQDRAGWGEQSGSAGERN